MHAIYGELFFLPILTFYFAICSTNSLGLFGLSRIGIPFLVVIKTEGLLLREYHRILPSIELENKPKYPKNPPLANSLIEPLILSSSTNAQLTKVSRGILIFLKILWTMTRSAVTS